MKIMAAVVLLLLLLAVSLAATTSPRNTSSDSPADRERSEEETRRIFTEWKAQIGMTGSSTAEEGERVYAMFKRDLHRMDRQWRDAGYPALSWDREMSEEETKHIFAEWKVRNGKTYISMAQEEHRYARFKVDLRDISRYIEEIDPFGNITMEALEDLACFHPGPYD